MVRAFSTGALTTTSSGESPQLLQLTANPPIGGVIIAGNNPPYSLRDLAVPTDDVIVGLTTAGTIHSGPSTGLEERLRLQTSDQRQLVAIAAATTTPPSSFVPGQVVAFSNADGALFEVEDSGTVTSVALPGSQETGELAVRAMAGFDGMLAVLHQSRVAIYARAASAWDLVASADLPSRGEGDTIAFHDRHVVVGAPRDDRCARSAGSVLVYRLFRPGDPGAGGTGVPVLVLKHTFASRDPIFAGAFGGSVAVQTLDTIGGAHVAVGSATGLDIFTTRTEDALPHTSASIDNSVGVADVQLLDRRVWVGLPDGGRGLIVSRRLP
jgi:hypothetical protein